MNLNAPPTGFYKLRLVLKGPWSPVRIWHGSPLSPEAPRLLDRSHRHQALLNGHQVPLDRVWPICGRWPIAESEYRYLLRLRRWALKYAPHEPAAAPLRRIDFATLRPAF